VEGVTVGLIVYSVESLLRTTADQLEKGWAWTVEELFFFFFIGNNRHLTSGNSAIEHPSMVWKNVDVMRRSAGKPYNKYSFI
jgi:hypothetical protein